MHTYSPVAQTHILLVLLDFQKNFKLTLPTAVSGFPYYYHFPFSYPI